MPLIMERGLDPVVAVMQKLSTRLGEIYGIFRVVRVNSLISLN